MIEHEQHGEVTLPLSRILGEKTGLCTNVVYTLPLRADPADGVVVRGDKPDISTLFDDENANGFIQSSGKGGSVREGTVTLLGETVERYVPQITHPDSNDARYTELAADYEMIDPKYLRLYSPSARERAAEYFGELDEFDPSDVRPWIAGTNLLTGEQTYLPLEFVYGTSGTDWNPIIPTTTNGLACHETIPQSVLASLYEQIERDAFMETWFTETTPNRIQTDEFPTETEQVRLHLLEYETGVDLPTVGCLGILSESNTSYPFFSGGAGETYRAAIRGASFEATQCIQLISGHKKRDVVDDIDPRGIDNLEDNVYYYYDTDNFDHLEFLLDGPSRSMRSIDGNHEFDGPGEELSFVLDRLAAEGVTPIAFDLTTPDVEDIGVNVTKVIIPELLQLSYPSFPFDRHPKLDGRIENEAPHPYP
ncbi:YcaO-like family protein [Halopiger goleimassiliensis]|uniref:YcaO-like family protein n=1 Tax=Halopiger goleimassiliensis TaxID=1293048 RepID=UPI00067792E6|nr:YcaO-like family protein [Halopiger goleimassiliensis]